MALPSMDTSLVTVKTDSLTCAQARTAFLAVITNDPDTVTPIVVRAGNYFVVSDPRAKSGTWKNGVTFDTLWVKVAHFDY